MEIIERPFDDCFLLKPFIIEDERGYFFESFNTQKFKDVTGISTNFVQDNQSYSSYGVIRGLHAQANEFAQAKLVRVLQGEVLDVIVDARKGSPSFGKSYSVKLSADNKFQLFIPRGFYHGFAVLSETAEFFYKCDNFYNKSSERGVFYADPLLNIDWIINEEDRVVAKKDLDLSHFNENSSL
ncbi:dTDP-4-dehydrorhamnose 3,5-epimerase [Albibacterium bauzanense]|uniref:dTDP-4-dehydrorhamnose 3,5-epimerase n=1 Tax=Albibacterium bauzanense TaxID=653929 RepID=A0A4R1LV63_9SPHI|nr:dTDP-4-dehydrorhamnose 3,5-epimerase [Albibacterium bauzanense]TCK83258.1 dTDP-4-dehydrorhamnose 3,5-epimerase [Albibacterium bauzanense]